MQITNIRRGTSGVCKTPAIWFSFSKGGQLVDTLEWLNENGDLDTSDESHLMAAHFLGVSSDRLTEDQIEDFRNSTSLTDDDIDCIRNRLQEYLAARNPRVA